MLDSFRATDREHPTLALPQWAEPLRGDKDKINKTFPGLLCQGQPWFWNCQTHPEGSLSADGITWGVSMHAHSFASISQSFPRHFGERLLGRDCCSRENLEGLTIRNLESLMMNLPPFPACSGGAQLCLSQDTGVGGGVRQGCVRQLNSATKKAAALPCLEMYMSWTCKPCFNDDSTCTVSCLSTYPLYVVEVEYAAEASPSL